MYLYVWLLCVSMHALAHQCIMYAPGPALPRVLNAVHTTAIQTLYQIYKTKLMQGIQIKQPRTRPRKK